MIWSFCQPRRTFALREADAVLCDLFMPGTDGLEPIQELRREFPNACVIALSGVGRNGVLDLLPVARHLGAAKVLTKPFDQAAALAAIRRVLELSIDDCSVSSFVGR